MQINRKGLKVERSKVIEAVGFLFGDDFDPKTTRNVEITPDRVTVWYFHDGIWTDPRSITRYLVD